MDAIELSISSEFDGYSGAFLVNLMVTVVSVRNLVGLLHYKWH